MVKAQVAENLPQYIVRGVAKPQVLNEGLGVGHAHPGAFPGRRRLHRFQVVVQPVDVLEPLTLGLVAGQHLLLRLEHARDVHGHLKGQLAAENVLHAQRVAVVEVGNLPGRRGGHPAVEVRNGGDEGGVSHQPGGLLVVHQVVRRRGRDHDLRIHLAHHPHGLASVRLVVLHFQVVASRVVVRPPQDGRRRGAFLQPPRADLLAGLGGGADLAAGHGGQMDLEPPFGQQGQRARRLEFHIVGMTHKG